MARDVKHSTVLLALFLVCLLTVTGVHAQSRRPIYVGKFTLTQQVHWGKTTLNPGSYTLTIESMGSPVIVSIRNSEGATVSHFMTAARGDDPTGTNALLIKEKSGYFEVYALALADRKIILTYDRDLAKEAIQEARVSQAVPVVIAKK